MPIRAATDRTSCDRRDTADGCDHSSSSDGDAGPPICDVATGAIDAGDGWSISTFVVGAHLNTPPVDCRADELVIELHTAPAGLAALHALGAGDLR